MHDVVTVTAPSGQTQIAMSDTLTPLALALVSWLKGKTDEARQLEGMALAASCADAIFGAYLVELAIRLARDNRFEEAEQTLERARGYGRSVEHINSGQNKIDLWRRAGLYSPAATIRDVVLN